ncbi:hypothetical protein HY230_03800 [Candidatus Acetothermia bacterium]|nr:hypothetical protein [Candidatus Acetothermia bacterium]
MVDFELLAETALLEFPDIIDSCKHLEGKLRLHLVDGSYIDLWWSWKHKGKFAYHWERRAVDGCIFRHDNIPDARWKQVKTFPKHFHNGHETSAEESVAPEKPLEGLRFMLLFARDYLRKSGKKG